MARETLAPWAEVVPNAAYPMTAEQLMGMGDAARGCELVEGRLVRMTPTGLEHSDIAGNLYTSLRGFVRARGLGAVTMPETGFVLSRPGEPDTVLAPDVAFVPAENLPAPDSPDRRQYVHTAPELVVEIVSPGQYRPEMAAKAQRWLEAGVRIVWIVWPTMREVDVWQHGDTAPGATLHQGDTLKGEGALADFTFPVSNLFV